MTSSAASITEAGGQAPAESQNSGTVNPVSNGQAMQNPSTGSTAPLAPMPEGQSMGRQIGGDNSSTPHHPIAEFLYQLTKMLTDDNREIIEWSSGKIKVHHPERLEGEVLHKYFRHSKFASFQRQLNYFGFRKIAGKGKMSPCSYVNDAATSDIRSLLLIKRKTNGSAARKAAMARGINAAAAAHPGAGVGFVAPGIGGAAQAGVSALGVQANLLNKALSGQAQALGSMGLHPSVLIPEMQQQAALQQQAQAFQSAVNHKPFGESLFFPSEKALAALAQGQKRQSIGDLAGLAMKSGLSGSLEQLNGQLGALAAGRNSALNLAALGVSPAAASAALAASMPATAAMAAAGTMPATAAMNSNTTPGNNLFGSNNNLSALVGNDQAAAAAAAAAATANSTNAKAPAPPSAATATASVAGAPPVPGAAGTAGAPGAAATSAASGVASRLSSQNLLSRLPSSSAIFPDSLSSVSLTGLLPGMSSNRLSSMLSLSSFLSRDPSMADLLPGAAGAAGATPATGATGATPAPGAGPIPANAAVAAAAAALMGAAGPATAAAAVPGTPVPSVGGPGAPGPATAAVNAAGPATAGAPGPAAPAAVPGASSAAAATAAAAALTGLVPGSLSGLQAAMGMQLAPLTAANTPLGLIQAAQATQQVPAAQAAQQAVQQQQQAQQLPVATAAAVAQTSGPAPAAGAPGVGFEPTPIQDMERPRFAT
eukprot:CAMPEP_0116855236 /NCGR_PEP_ID=MMETSP0418-20121206/19138_1 /TAXON_ID=1158023 /ORGANISM="Astrosyne radiata, Strain 13vi08-1A" /LENGTH=711 /DNA_ID=CAMNT_0004488291 /DNA_START=133 /DNA_END=2268 /DNA_ORIENTATION=-